MKRSEKWTAADIEKCVREQDADSARRGQDLYDYSMLRVAIELNRKDLVRGLLELGAPIHAGMDQRHQSVLTYAAEYADGEMVELLCRFGADARQTFEFDWTSMYMRDEIGRGLTALHRAAAKGNVSAVEALVERGADVNACTQDEVEWTPLFKAVEFLDKDPATIARRGEIVDFLLDHGAIPHDRSISDKYVEHLIGLSDFARRHGYARLLQALASAKR